MDMTITKELTAITETLKLAKHAQCYPFDPRDLRPPDFVAKYEARKRVMTVAEASELMRALPPRRAAHVAFFLATGARLSEAERAQSGDIDWEGGSVFLRGTKTKASERTVPIITFTSPMLQAAEPWMPFMAWTNIQRDLELACKRAGIPKVTPNDLRRTTATWLVEFGVPYDIVARVLGHTSTQMLHRVYGRPRDASVGKIIDAKYMESGSGTDPSQLGSAAAGRSPQNPSKAPVAQRIEQRFPNPLAIAENIGELAEYGDRVTSISPQDAAQTRIGSYRSVTLLLPPVEAARKALEAVGSSEDPETVAEALFEMRRLRGARAGAALLDASRIAASGDADAEERIVEILETVAEDLGGAK